MIAALCYEFRMQVRRPVLWVVYGLTLAALIATFGESYTMLDLGRGGGHDPKAAMVTSATITMTLLPIVYGCMLADRLVRDRRLGVAAILDATPSGRTGRLIGKYLGTCAATATPFAVAYFGRAVVWVIMEGRPAALGWSALMFLLGIVPGLLFLGALSVAGPLLMPPLLFRVLFAGYWVWGNLIPATMMPTLSHTVFAADSDYVPYGLLRLRMPDGMSTTGPWPGASLNLLRPVATPSVALLWIGLMVALAAAVLSLARLHTALTES
ncbi:hypothetical protein N5079_21255 [Planotetraspora sp. A-T 1434]|uniref:hypothetical protein n=1 Tax=Planotetraspora sp. A-T 1434 TaxID=2979219 RepID=UPI0021C2320E|nr:hypothetical protein [Planotetraspora sp. A-T 1434]MCT9932735.1 hypothetical protein [Planotetraspora sp. A-T 1434]